MAGQKGGEDPVIAALAAALHADPANHPVRAHLGEVLLQQGKFAEALAQGERILGEEPANVAALRVCAVAAESMGDGRSEGWHQLLAALGEAPEADRRSADPMPPRTAVVPESLAELTALWDTEEGPIEPEIGELVAPSVTLDDVAGLAHVKARLEMSLLAPMRNPEMRNAFGKSMRGGLLLWGPPGCGKTYLARACAGELGANFYAVGLSDVLGAFLGQSERNLADIFDVARQNTPCILFFDEIDAIGQKRAHLRASAMRGVVNQFLEELDGARKDNDGVFVLGATNHPWDVDAALLRPGRFDRMMLVLPPDVEARTAVLAGHLRGKPQERLDLARVAAKTEGYSGADLALVVESATERAMDASITHGKVRPITDKDLKAALKESRPSTDSWLSMARNYATYGNDSGDFDDLLEYLRARRRR